MVRESNEILQSELQLITKLGEGKFGIVYKGSFKGQKCAVKMLKSGSDSKDSIQYEKLLIENSILESG
jgi:predicted Ser/Thr protein kinase